jgi:hypothetical protein
MRLVRRAVLLFTLIFLVPLATHAAWWMAHDHPASFAEADWSASGVLPVARSETDAAVHVLAGRTGRWKGIFAHHSWIVVKPKGATRYTRYEVVGWGMPVRTDAYAPDGRWYGDTPSILASLRGEAAERAIPRIRAAVAAYPHASRGSYTIWPGPNSNTFVASVLRIAAPELAPALLPTALGKDYLGPWMHAGLTPSRTGVQLSLRGMAGISAGWVEGVEINVGGLVAGVDLRRPALKLPGWGRVGMRSV